MTNQFKEFNKIPRLSRDMIITEKLDGTNACIVITEEGDIFAQSRSRIITPWEDNYWFAKWVEDHKEELMKMWPWYHYGEWRWQGIQRKYNMTKKVFSLFYFRGKELPTCISMVPILYEWPFDTSMINTVMDKLERGGSIAAPWFMKPEGIVIFHTAANCVFKKTFEKDEGKFNS